MEGLFRDWLTDALQRHQVSRRELARRLADRAPDPDADPESYRRNLTRILSGAVSPTQPTRDAIQEALDDWSGPSQRDEEQDTPVTREMVLRKLNEYQRDFRMFKRILTEGGRL